MAIVNREWAGFGANRRLIVSDVRGIEEPYEIPRDAAVKAMGGEEAAIEYGIKAAASDAGSGAKDARGKIAATKARFEGTIGKEALLAGLAEKEAENAMLRAKLAAAGITVEA